MITIPVLHLVGVALGCVAIGWLVGIAGTHKESGVLK